MVEYIEREAALDICEKEYQERLRMMDYCGDTVAGNIGHAIKSLPTADVAPVVYGRWDDSGRYSFPGGATAVRCTNCGCALTESEYRLNNWNYCPCCGAKMDGGADHADN